jgi:hypothetical protein
MKTHAAAVVLRARRDFAVARTKPTNKGDPVPPALYQRGQCPVVAGRGPQGVPAFLVTLAPVLPLTVVLARLFAAVFGTPLLRHHSWPKDAGQEHPSAEGALG